MFFAGIEALLSARECGRGCVPGSPSAYASGSLGRRRASQLSSGNLRLSCDLVRKFGQCRFGSCRQAGSLLTFCRPLFTPFLGQNGHARSRCFGFTKPFSRWSCLYKLKLVLPRFLDGPARFCGAMFNDCTAIGRLYLVGYTFGALATLQLAVDYLHRFAVVVEISSTPGNRYSGCTYRLQSLLQKTGVRAVQVNLIQLY